MKVGPIAIIPARSGSQRVKGKNLRNLAGKPLLAYSIECAIVSGAFSRVVLSTDSEDIAEIGRSFGAHVPFLRPADISNSTSTELEFLQHALSHFQEVDEDPELVSILYPTSPFRKPESIVEAVRLLFDHPEADSLRSVRKCSEHPYKMWKRDGNWLTPFVDAVDSNVHASAYQILPAVYIQNASIYITRPSTIREKQSSIGDRVLCFEMDEIESFDINTELDFEIAEMLLRNDHPRK